MAVHLCIIKLQWLDYRRVTMTTETVREKKPRPCDHVQSGSLFVSDMVSGRMVFDRPALNELTSARARELKQSRLVQHCR